MAKTKKTAKNKPKTIVHALGDKHFVAGVECQVRLLNAGSAWLCPTIDDPDEPLVARHIAFARIDEYGKVTVL